MSSSIPQLDDLLKSYTERPDGLTGLAAIAVNKNGDIVYSGVSGKTSADASRAAPLTLDHVHWIASKTKLLTAISAMQCVERGQIGLDDPVGDILPELADPDILEGYDDGGEPKLRKATTKITLKMLLTHSSGLAYTGTSPLIKQWCERRSAAPRLTESIRDYTFPLIFEPGTSWVYGVGIDWAGQLVERLNNCTLGEYMTKNIFTPLGMNSSTFHPENHPEIESRLVDMSTRLPDGTMAYADRVYGYPAEQDLGGVGLYSTPADYIKVLAALLQDGGALLKPESVDAIFKPQGEKVVGDAHNQWSNMTAFAPSEVSFGLSVSIAVAPYPEKRAAGSVAWGGLPCLIWWVDRKTGIAATIFQQTLPYSDSAAFEFMGKFEEVLYKHVRA
ncbi:hypothetical protein BOTBODRAFT_33049 [Botryobasidium botryosum FD-172 SS1]|uniref:Beta-lactamase-related domain-containing protein n=1 Tax=Botryobasidium botryosum (strain FD-172 SS1) TaxID=930990 RepID=A0A067MQS2_BOTB1|nr:hypothetical protein BOTBODRAFT_33049 [Botryobasidium botryosum FD-172 SS1]